MHLVKPSLKHVINKDCTNNNNEKVNWISEFSKINWNIKRIKVLKAETLSQVSKTVLLPTNKSSNFLKNKWLIINFKFIFFTKHVLFQSHSHLYYYLLLKGVQKFILCATVYMSGNFVLHKVNLSICTVHTVTYFVHLWIQEL